MSRVMSWLWGIDVLVQGHDWRVGGKGTSRSEGCENWREKEPIAMGREWAGGQEREDERNRFRDILYKLQGKIYIN